MSSRILLWWQCCDKVYVPPFGGPNYESRWRKCLWLNFYCIQQKRKYSYIFFLMFLDQLVFWNDITILQYSGKTMRIFKKRSNSIVYSRFMYLCIDIMYYGVVLTIRCFLFKVEYVLITSPRQCHFHFRYLWIFTQN